MPRFYYYDWPPYVPVAERRRKPAEKVAKMKKAGRNIAPVEISGRKITTTFWGDAWCTNLEAYSDYSNRLPRGRSYVRNGSVIDLQIEGGLIRSLVSGSSIYKVTIRIQPLKRDRWSSIKGRCSGEIGSLVELLRGTLSRGVMEIVTRKGEGLFPSPREISLKCSCPDSATMCKHVAATLYGVGARLDERPELLFTLRGVDPAEMVEAAVEHAPGKSAPRGARVLASDELSSVFGVDIDLDDAPSEPETPPSRKAPRAKRPSKKAPPKKRPAKKAPARKGSAKKAASKRKPPKRKPTSRKATRKSREKAS